MRKAANPGWGFGKFGKAIGAEWQRMSDAQKAPYRRKSEQDRLRYHLRGDTPAAVSDR